MGTPDFAVPGLLSLLNDKDFEVVAVYSQKDKPVGRKQEVKMTPVKELAVKFNIPVFQVDKLKPELENIQKLQADLIVVIAYGKIIPQSILDLPKYGCINVHASLLPKYRGAACLNAPILYGDTETGITIMQMEAGLDTGPIIKQEKIILTGKEKLKDVHDQLSSLGAKILAQTLKDWTAGKLKVDKQDDNKASYIGMLKKEDGKLDLNKSAIELERMIRAFNPWPGSYVILDNQALKIIEASVIESEKGQIGEILKENNHLIIRCGQKSLDILKLQMPGKKVMTSKEFLNGKQDIIAKILQ